jgi:hypothetical protein
MGTKRDLQSLEKRFDLLIVDLCVVPRYVESGGSRHSDSR